MATGKNKRGIALPNRELDTTVTIRIEDKMVRAIDLIARKQKRTRSNLIRLALEQAIRKNP